MATGDFAWLKLQLANMVGLSTVAQLDDAGTFAGQIINEALLDCYQNPSGARPGFAQQLFGIQLGAPLTGTITVTQGSRIISGYSFPANRIGSTVQVGQSYYTYAGQNAASQYTFVEPVAETSGSYSFTIWHNSYPLDLNIGEVQGAPINLSWGPLSPMNSRAEDYRWRALVYGDFMPPPGGWWGLGQLYWPGGINYPVGVPMFYRIENGPLSGVTTNNGPAEGVIQSGTVSLSPGDVDVDVTFGTAYSSPPTVEGDIEIPTGGYVIDSNPVSASITTTGFTSEFAAAIPDTGYTFAWRSQGETEVVTSMAVATPRSLFIVEPMPTAITTIQFTGWLLPAEMVDDDDVPQMPGDLVTRVLLPLCREKWAMLYKKYTGSDRNYAGIRQSADNARAILQRMSMGQRDKPIRMNLRNC